MFITILGAKNPEWSSIWDVSRVEGMNSMFYQVYLFNGDVSKWDVSKVRDTNSMFYEASNFNNDVSKWVWRT